MNNIQDMDPWGDNLPIRLHLTDEQWDEVWLKFYEASKQLKEKTK